MTFTYSTYQAKARFSELIQRVRAGHRVIITHRGKVVAELRAAAAAEPDAALKELEASGVLHPPDSANRVLQPIHRRRGALKRFLASRE